MSLARYVCALQNAIIQFGVVVVTIFFVAFAVIIYLYFLSALSLAFSSTLHIEPPNDNDKNEKKT